MYFNANFKTFASLINSAFVGVCVCVCVYYVDFRMHGATIKKMFSLMLVNTAHCFDGAAAIKIP